MTDFTVTKKQNILDICIQVYGTTQLLFKFAKDNGLKVDGDISKGDVLVYDESLSVLNVTEAIQRRAYDIINPNINVNALTFDDTTIKWDSTEITWDQTQK